MGFKRGALLGPLELLHLEQCADFDCRLQQASAVCLKARGSQRWVPCGGHPGENVSLRLSPRFIFWHRWCWTPLLRARRDAYLVWAGRREGGNPPAGFQWEEGALLWLIVRLLTVYPPTQLSSQIYFLVSLLFLSPWFYEWSVSLRPFQVK